ncbi:MAG: pyrroline-5-carboxylate reductase [Gammaproteobacteria bacterium]|nr:pyrroline-5-carboxylate reductase [Gammaproteobacteria bacterium]
MTTKTSTIAFIGGGNMARSLIGGLLADGYNAQNIRVSDPDQGQRDAIKKNFAVHAVASNQEAIKHADAVILAVKPQVLRTVAEDLAKAAQKTKPLIISIAAGIRADALNIWLGDDLPIVRAMPNTPALVGSGATALYANTRVSKHQHDLAESIMRAVGLALWLDHEAQMDAVTALSGSGPAYFFLIMEALENAGRELGLPPETARLLTLQTAFGAAKMALESTEDSATLRARVTSPGGTTEQAIKVLQEGQIKNLFSKALAAAHGRSIEMAELLGGARG